MLRTFSNLLNRINLEYSSKLIFPTKSNRILNLKLHFSQRVSYTNEVAPRNFLHRYFENSFAYTILEPLPALNKSEIRNNLGNKNLNQLEIVTNEDFTNFLNKDWRKANIDEIVNGFNKVLNYCIENKVDVSDTRFDPLIDGLIDNVEHLKTEDLITILTWFNQAPLPQGKDAHNYHDVWSALDDICCWRLRNWNTETAFRIANLWYKLGLGRYCDFMFELLDKYSRKPARLSKTELVYIFFYFNVCRKKSMDYAYEDAVEKMINFMSPDEIGLIAMGFFKTQTRVKSANTLIAMLDCAINNIESIHEISLTSIIKTIRLSHHPQTARKIWDLLEIVQPQINRLSYVCCLHIALLGTSLQILNEKTLTAVCEKFLKEINNVNVVRLKDIERLLLTLTMLNFEPQIDGNIFEILLKQFYNPERKPEIEKYTKCLPAALLFLTTRDIYAEDLISEVLNQDYICKNYGKRYSDVPRELYTLDMNVEIERPDYKGCRIPTDIRRRCAKIYIEKLPRRERKSMNMADRLIYDVVDCCSNVVGDSSKVFLGHVLPQYAKADIVLCYDKTQKSFIEPKFPQYHIGDIVKPPKNDNNKWIVVLPVSVNTTIRYILKPVGLVNIKARQLKLLGYEVILVPYHEFLQLNEDDRLKYIKSKVKSAL